MRACEVSLDSELSAAELDFLLSSINEYSFSGKHMEIGTAAGGTLWQMVKSLGKKSGARFVVVDPMTYFPGQLEAVKKNLADHGVNPSSVDIRVARSHDACSESIERGEKFDFIFIDGSHKIKYVTQDLRWARLLNTGGILMLHDYIRGKPGVTLSVDRFLRRNKNYKKIGLVGSLIALQKKSAGKSREVSASDHLFALLWTPLLQLQMSAKKWKKKYFKKKAASKA